MATSLRTSALPVRCTQTGLLRNFVLLIAVLAAGRSLAGEDAMPPEDPEGRKEAVAAETREQEVYVGGDDDILRALEQAAALEREENWPEAAALYRSIIEKHLDHIASTMVSASADRTRGELYITAAEQSRRRLLAFPADARAALEARHGQAAQAAVDQALANRDAAALHDAALRFAGTDAALAALDALGDIRFERGDAASAAQAWEELLQALPAGSGRRAPATVKLAHARSALGDAAGARALIDAIPLRTEVTLGGRRIAADTLADSLLGPPPPAAVDEWLAIAGNAACNAFPGRVFDVGRRL